ncbi:MAG: DUF59 domain-containing protein [Bacteroidota bacterium]
MTEVMEQIEPEKIIEVENKVYDVIKTIYDPEIPVNILELGLIYEVAVTPFGDAHIRMTLTSPNCPVAGSLPGEVEMKVETVPEIKSAEVELTFDPPWDQEMMSEEAKLELGFM